ncbi:hypothetical protein ACLF6K_01200 [Streptomyces xanthophaeus]|uniref:hypothetical protein n=2 Tax=Streptomyces TaxID=1883 RepID=UPI0039901C4D
MTNSEITGADSAAAARQRRIRRAAMWGGVVGLLTTLILGFSFVVQGWDLGIPAWITLPLPAAAAVLAVWGGAREGREDGILQEILADNLAPGEVMLSFCSVRPSPIDPSMPDVWDECELRVTNHRLLLWQGTTLLWSRPWSELHLTADGDDQVTVHGQEGPIVGLTLQKPTMPEELVLAAVRLKARAAH